MIANSLQAVPLCVLSIFIYSRPHHMAIASSSCPLAAPPCYLLPYSVVQLLSFLNCSSNFLHPLRCCLPHHCLLLSFFRCPAAFLPPLLCCFPPSVALLLSSIHCSTAFLPPL